MQNNILTDLLKISKRNIIKIILLQVFVSGLSIYYLALIKSYVDECVSKKNLSLIVQSGIIILCISFIIIIVRYYYSTRKNNFVKKAAAYIRNRVISHVLLLKLKNFEKYLTSELSMIINYDIPEFMDGIFSSIFSHSIHLFIFLIAIFYIFSIDIITSIFLIAEFIVLWILLQHINRRLSTLSEGLRNRAGIINNFVNDTLEGIYEINLFDRKDDRYNTFLQLNKKYSKNYRTVSFFTSIPLKDIWQFIMMASVILVLGIKMIKTNQNIYGELLTFFLAIGYILNPVSIYSRVIEKIQRSLKSLTRMNELMALDKDDINKKATGKLQSVENIKFENVYFSYTDDKLVLKDINLTINKGEKIAIVGVNGSGKSTLISLINRSYTPVKGDILINGRDISDYLIKELRKRIEIVLQESNLEIDDPIENIRLGDDISMNKIASIVDGLFGSGFSRRLVNKKTPVELSKTQRHLLNVVQALIRDADVYIFDEITSDLDTQTELELKMFIERYFKDKTCIFITHQIHSLPKISKIIVMHDGEIKEMGSHKELLVKMGLYYTLYNIQYLETLFTKIIQMVGKLALKDGYTRYHYLKSALLVRRVCEKLDLSQDLTNVIELAGYLSDIGKLQIPEEILKKRGTLSPEEKELVQQHVVFGSKITREMKETYAISHIIYHHHERWDGGGYPEGLKGEDIPFGSRILTIVDSYRAMMTGRPYRSKLGQKESIRRLKLGAGTHFDPHLVDIFLEVLNEEREKELGNRRIIEGYERWYSQLSKRK